MERRSRKGHVVEAKWLRQRLVPRIPKSDTHTFRFIEEFRILRRLVIFTWCVENKNASLMDAPEAWQFPFGRPRPRTQSP